MRASIITVGDELLIGQVVDTNSAWLGQKLSELGIAVSNRYAVGDDHKDIVEAMTVGFKNSDIIFITGGLGPTKDDITKKAIADFLGVKMYFDKSVWERIVKIFDKLERPISESHKDQSYMPEGVKLLRNSMGTAPGMLFEYQGKYIMSLPGVPYEMKAIVEEEALEWLMSLTPINIVHKTLLTSGAGETVIENAIAHLVESFPTNLKIAYLPNLGSVRVRLTIKDEKPKEELLSELNKYSTLLEECLSEYIFGYDDTSLENEIKKLSVDLKIKVATAESCTGGAIAARLVQIPGSSQYFNGGIIAYSDDIKNYVLNVHSSILNNFGAVSEETVKAMVDGVLWVMHSDVAVAISGIAGPDGGSPTKPVGTIWICVGNSSDKVTFLLKVGKSREKNIEIATNYALSLLRKFIYDFYILKSDDKKNHLS